MHIVFMGSADFAVPSLRILAQHRLDIVKVYTQPPAHAGRGRMLRPTPVHELAMELGIQVSTPDDLTAPIEIKQFRELIPDLAVVVAYGKLIPEVMLSVPKRGFLNVHPSLLPKWRGAAPVQRAIMAVERQTGICILKMNEQFDAGPILLKEVVDILPTDTSATLSARLAEQGATMLYRAITCFDDLVACPQVNNNVSYARKITKTETHVDWEQNASQIDAMIRGLSPFPGAWSTCNGQRIKFLMSRVVGNHGKPGMVIDENLTIACGTGAVQILQCQAAGGSAMDTLSFLRGQRIQRGDNFQSD